MFYLFSKPKILFHFKVFIIQMHFSPHKYKETNPSHKLAAKYPDISLYLYPKPIQSTK